jgi:hypothetical protein
VKPPPANNIFSGSVSGMSTPVPAAAQAPVATVAPATASTATKTAFAKSPFWIPEAHDIDLVAEDAKFRRAMARREEDRQRMERFHADVVAGVFKSVTVVQDSNDSDDDVWGDLAETEPCAAAAVTTVATAQAKPELREQWLPALPDVTAVVPHKACPTTVARQKQAALSAAPISAAASDIDSTYDTYLGNNAVKVEDPWTRFSDAVIQSHMPQSHRPQNLLDIDADETSAVVTTFDSVEDSCYHDDNLNRSCDVVCAFQ